MRNSYPTLTQPAAYRIRIVGNVKINGSDFMTDFQERHLQDDDTSVTELAGVVADQSALFGLLCHLRDRGLPLVSVEYLPPGEE